MTKKDFGSHIAVTPNTKKRFDLLQRYLGLSSADALLNKLMDFFTTRKRINDYKLNKFKRQLG